MATDDFPDPAQADFREVAKRSQKAGIADESAGYVRAMPGDANSKGPQTVAPSDEDARLTVSGSDDPSNTSAEVAQSEPAEPAPDESDSIEPVHSTATAEDIEVGGVARPGPSG